MFYTLSKHCSLCIVSNMNKEQDFNVNGFTRQSQSRINSNQSRTSMITSYTYDNIMGNLHGT
jgi:hypothetical protein